jgi:hypothetical protein
MSKVKYAKISFEVLDLGYEVTIESADGKLVSSSESNEYNRYAVETWQGVKDIIDQWVTNIEVEQEESK